MQASDAAKEGRPKFTYEGTRSERAARGVSRALPQRHEGTGNANFVRKTLVGKKIAVTRLSKSLDPKP